MKNTLAVIAFLVTSVAIAQTTVTYNADLYAVGTVYTNRVVDPASFVPGAPGAGFWDFTVYGTGAESDFTSIAYDAEIPHIDDCAVTPNYIVYYHDITDTTDLEGWGFSKIDPNYVEGLGLYGTLESDGSTYELATFNDTYTHSHDFPIDMSDSWIEATSGGGFIVAFGFTIDYDVQDTNWYNVDGYGQIVLPSGTFDALRITKRHWRHSHSSHILFGFDKTERRFSYIWACTELGFAVTYEGPIDSTGGMPDSTFTTGKLTMQIANSSLGVAENPAIPDDFGVYAYPNPFNSSVNLGFRGVARGEAAQGQVGIQIFDISGKLVSDLPLPPAIELSREPVGSLESSTAGGATPLVWIPDESLPSGVYYLKMVHNGVPFSTKLVYLK